MPWTAPPMPVPRVNRQLGSGEQLGWLRASVTGSTGWPSEYGVSLPRSSRLSWMLLRARLAVMSSYVGHVRAAIVTSRSVPRPFTVCADAAGAAARSAITARTINSRPCRLIIGRWSAHPGRSHILPRG